MVQTLGEVADKIRSKNAGPFWITIDIFCGDTPRYEEVIASLSNQQIAQCLQLEVGQLKRFDMPELYAIKISFARPIVQGSAGDRDMHGAQYAVLVAQLKLA